MDKTSKKFNQKKVYGTYIIIFLFGFVFSFLISKYFDFGTNSLPQSASVRKPTNNKYVSPLLLSSDSPKLYEDTALSHTVSSYIDKKIKEGKALNISFYFRDLRKGNWAGVNENERYAPASLMKVPVMIAILKQAESDPSLLNKKLIYDGKLDLNKAESYPPKKQILVNTPYSVDELLKYMITYSDNNAMSLLLAITPLGDIKEIYSDLGLPIPEDESYGTIDYMSSKLYSRLFRVLYNSTYLNEDYSEKAMQILTTSDFDNGISFPLPKDIEVANKFGERTVFDKTLTTNYKELHDCGIVYEPQKPYAICIMTKGNDFKDLEGIIQDISKISYDQIGK